ncbi:MAG: hypothetical protein IT366_12655 [Candidatus Hydrogenedentes bacterium]|nr:hypothetical protein [Candidatus Hydrogenedentota bacterium]
MTRTEFQSFVEQSIREVLELAEKVLQRELTLAPYLRWNYSSELIKENLAEAITARVYIDSEHIYPCVDLGVGEVDYDGRPILYAIISSHAPEPFGKNRDGRPGPFIYILPAK